MKKCFTLTVSLILVVSIGLSQQKPVFVWAKNQGSNAGDNPATTVTDASGNIFTTGTFRNASDFDPGSGVVSPTVYGNADIFISKLDRDGNLVWVKSVGGTNDDFAGSITLDDSGNIFVVGGYSSTADFDPGSGSAPLTSSASQDVFILKLDINGAFVWAKSIGGPLSETAGSIQVDLSGNVFIAGTFRSSIADFDPGPASVNIPYYGQNDVYILKLDQNGNYVWAKSFGGNSFDSIGQLELDNSGSMYVTGTFTGLSDFDPSGSVSALTSGGTNDAFIAKYASDGSLVWAKQLGLAGSDTRGINVGVTNSGEVITSGMFTSTSDFDPGSGSFTLTSAGDFDTFVSKLTAAGDFVWAKRMGSATLETLHSMDLDAAGNVYTAGIFQGARDFDPGPAEYLLSPTFGYGTFLSKLDGSGNFVWGSVVGGVSGGSVRSLVTIDNSGDLVSVGSYSGTAGDFDPGACVYNLPAGYIYTLKLRMNVIPTDPTIGSFSPTSGPVGTPVTITGTNFSTTPANNTVSFNAVSAVVSASTATSITTSVPSSASTGKITVTTGCITATSSADFVVTGVTIPTITGFTPAIGPVGTIVVITGTNFNTTPVTNVVKFNGTTATVSSSTATSITVVVPAGATTGLITVTIGANTATSTNAFTVVTGTNELIVYNALSPLGSNPKFVIQSIEILPDTKSNTVVIYDRWQNEVWRGTDYDNTSIVFTGSGTSGDLPTGTYYYRIEFTSGRESLTGFISLKR